MVEIQYFCSSPLPMDKTAKPLTAFPHLVFSYHLFIPNPLVYISDSFLPKYIFCFSSPVLRLQLQILPLGMHLYFMKSRSFLRPNSSVCFSMEFCFGHQGWSPFSSLLVSILSVYFLWDYHIPLSIMFACECTLSPLLFNQVAR